MSRSPRNSSWEHLLRLTLPRWPPFILWQARADVAEVVTPELLGSTTVVLAGECLLSPGGSPGARLLLGVLPLVEGVIVLLGQLHAWDARGVAWLSYAAAATSWGLRALHDIRPRHR
jgi:hypothetical protein